jgi:hypothetical protein
MKAIVVIMTIKTSCRDDTYRAHRASAPVSVKLYPGVVGFVAVSSVAAACTAALCTTRGGTSSGAPYAFTSSSDHSESSGPASHGRSVPETPRSITEPR